MAEQAFVKAVLHHTEPPSARVSGVDVVVTYDQREARLHIQLEPELDAHLVTNEFLSQEVRRLAEALLHISDQPSIEFDRNPHRTQT